MGLDSDPDAASQELRAAGLPCDFPPNKIKQGHGEVGASVDGSGDISTRWPARCSVVALGSF